MRLIKYSKPLPPHQCPDQTVLGTLQAASTPAAAPAAVPAPAAAAAESGLASVAAGNLLSGPALETAIAGICEMGFEREQVGRWIFNYLSLISITYRAYHYHATLPCLCLCLIKNHGRIDTTCAQLPKLESGP